MNTYLGIDIGGTSVKLGWIDEEGHILRKAEQSVIYDGYRTPIMEIAADAAERFLNDVREDGTAPYPAGIGISATGQIDTVHAAVAGTAGHIPHYAGTRFREILEERMALPVTALNDAKCAVLAESWIGSARGVRNVVLVVIGTGIGGGIISDGTLIKGRDGYGGEIGHTILVHGGELCSCGNRGCFECYGSTKRLVRNVSDAVKEGLIGAERFPSGVIDGKTICEALRSRPQPISPEQGEDMLVRIVDEWEEIVSDGLTSLIHTFQPERVILGGGISNAGEVLLRPIREKVMGRIMPLYRESLEITNASLRNDAGMIGAVRYHMLTASGEEALS